MPSITGLSASSLASIQMEARRVVAQYDRNGDGRISRDEAQQQINMGPDSYSFRNRVSDNYVEVTTVFQNKFRQLRPDGLAAADLRGDGNIDADELVEGYLRRRDSNHNGSLGFFEKMGTSAEGLREMVEQDLTVETNRSTRLEYDPEPVVVVVPAGPTPPPADPWRPAPPSVRPTPPSVGPRPVPPSPSSRQPSSR